MLVFKSQTLTQAVTTASDNIVLGPVDISEWESYCLTLFNSSTAAMADIHIQLAPEFYTADSASSAPNWVAMNTAVIPYPSALGRTATVQTCNVLNCNKWLRVRAHTTATGGFATGAFRMTISGHTRG